MSEKEKELRTERGVPIPQRTHFGNTFMTELSEKIDKKPTHWTYETRTNAEGSFLNASNAL
jgi:hypothetical protein